MALWPADPDLDLQRQERLDEIKQSLQNEVRVAQTKALQLETVANSVYNLEMASRSLDPEVRQYADRWLAVQRLAIPAIQHQVEAPPLSSLPNRPPVMVPSRPGSDTMAPAAGPIAVRSRPRAPPPAFDQGDASFGEVDGPISSPPSSSSAPTNGSASADRSAVRSKRRGRKRSRSDDASASPGKPSSPKKRQRTKDIGDSKDGGGDHVFDDSPVDLWDFVDGERAASPMMAVDVDDSHETASSANSGGVAAQVGRDGGDPGDAKRYDVEIQLTVTNLAKLKAAAPQSLSRDQRVVLDQYIKHLEQFRA